MGKWTVPTTVAMAKALGWSAIQVECVRADCRHRHITEIPWTMIAGGEGRSLASIVGRLRCSSCRRAPFDVCLLRRVADNEKGAPTQRLLSIAHLADG